MENNKLKKIIFPLFGIVGLYLLTVGLSYAAWGVLLKESSGFISPLAVSEGRAKIDLSAPKTEACPLSGALFTKAERAIWEKRRPLGVMIENHLDSRPQSGLSSADIVYEAIAEGGITRFLSIFLCGASAADVQIGPVRSARTYFVDWISEYADYPLYAHVGGANNFDGSGLTNLKARALEQIESYGWNLYNDLSGMSLGFPVYWRDYERLGRPVATEHTMYSSSDRLWEVAEKRNLTQVNEDGQNWQEFFTAWQFQDEANQKDRGQSGQIQIKFWSNKPDYDVTWTYSPEDNSYQRQSAQVNHQDLNTESPLKTKIVIAQFVKETGPVDDLKHLLYQTIGSGKGIVFQDGQSFPVTWEKDSRQGRTIFSDQKGQEFVFARGPIWIEIIPAGQDIDY